jgi:hypothetical protein
MKYKLIIPFLLVLLFSCTTENETADDSVLGIWKITKAFQGNQSETNESGLIGCETSWRYSFGADYYFNELSLAAEGTCPLATENAYKWAETALNTYECRRTSDNELYFTTTIENGTMTMFRPDIDTTYLLKHTTD